MPFTMVNIVKTWPSTHGRPLGGEVALTPDAPFRNGSDWSASYSGQVSATGQLSMQVPATDDSGTTPAGVRYRVVEQVPGVVSRPYYIAVPAAAGTVNLGTVTKLDSPSSAGRGTEPVTRSELADAVAGVSSGGGGSYTDEQARDAIGAALVGGSNISVTVDDAGNTITVAATGLYTDEQAQDAVASALAAGTHSGAAVAYNDGANSLSITATGDLPEFATSAQTAAVGTPANMVGKLTRYDTTAGAISQALPAATAGRVVAVGWDAGTNALTLTAAGSDVIGSGAATTVTVPLVGEVLTYHCTTAGRWRVVSGFKTQAALDARYPVLTGGVIDDAVIPPGIARDSEVASAVAALVNSAPSTRDTLKEISDQLDADESAAAALAVTVGNKLAKASNLSDLASLPTARTNLGLTAPALVPVIYGLPGQTVWPGANQAVFARFSVPIAGSYRYLRWKCDIASGNVQLGIVSLSSTDHATFTRVAHTGVIACPAAGDIRTDLGATALPAGDYAIFLWADNATFATRLASNSGLTVLRVVGTATGLTTGVGTTGTLTWASTFVNMALEGEV